MLKQNEIYLGDCLEIMKNIPDKSIDMILSDPPYGINYLSNWTNNHTKIINDDFENYIKLLKPFFVEAKRVLTDTGCCCCCCGGGGKKPVSAYFTIEAIKHFNLIQTLVWYKFIGLGWRYRPSYENIIILSKSKEDYNFYDKTKKCPNVIKLNQEIPQKNEHPTKKPVELMQILLKIHSRPGDNVLDPFAGSGTTGVACKNLGRNYILIEKEEKYFNLAKERLENTQDPLLVEG